MTLSVWIVSDKGVSPSTRRLLEIAEARGHAAICLAPADASFALGKQRSTVLGPAMAPDVVLARMGGGTERAAFDVLFAFEALAVPVISPTRALLVARDKALTALALGAHDIPSPRSAWVTPARLTDALEIVPGPPWILKAPAGHQGNGVALLPSLEALRSAVSERALTCPRLLVQEHLPAGTSDLRVVVADGEVVAAMRRTAPEGDFRSNLHRGGSAAAVVLPAALASLAQRAAAAVGLTIAGVDLVETPDGPVVLEVNASPGLMGIEATTGIEVAGALLTAVEHCARRQRALSSEERDERDRMRT
jgi:ribosomal protein S6--L-glutamate ligase